MGILKFLLYMSFLALMLKMIIHIAWEAQIALLLAKEITVLAKYTNFINVFWKKLVKVLPK